MTEEDDHKTIETEKAAHALENWLDIEEGSTESQKITYNAPSDKSEHYDVKDREIEENAHKIFNEAMTGYYNLEKLLDNMEPKYRARMAEVALQYLKTALDASDSKSKQKESIEKLLIQREKASKTNGDSGNTQIYFGDRNELLKSIRDAEDKKNNVIDVTPDDEKEENNPEEKDA